MLMSIPLKYSSLIGKLFFHSRKPSNAFSPKGKELFISAKKAHS